MLVRKVLAGCEFVQCSVGGREAARRSTAQHSTARLSSRTGQIAPLLSSALRRNSVSDLDLGEFTDAEQSRY